MTYKYLVLGSGGYKAFTYIGVLNNLDITPEVIVGCSAGALLGFLLSISKSIASVESEALDPNHVFFSFNDVSFKTFFCKYGFNDGYNIEKLLVELCVKYLKTQRINFEEFYNMTNIDFHVIASNLSTKRYVDFNRKDTPNADVITALRMSISIPFYFTPVIYKSEYYVDGGVYMPEPYIILERNYGNQINKDNTIVLTVDHCITTPSINSLSDYIQTIFEVIRCSLQCHDVDHKKCTYIKIDANNIPMIKHDYTPDNVRDLIIIGNDVKKIHKDLKCNML